ncbi:hypothetical protein ABPG72_021353 [Tetrahymena utriculariae]
MDQSLLGQLQTNQDFKVMTNGAFFIKHHRYTCPKLRFIWVAEDIKEICWSDPKNQKQKVSGKIRVEEITNVKVGAMKSKALPKEEMNRNNNIITLVTHKRTLEIEANSQIQRDQWLNYIEILLQKNGIAAIQIQNQNLKNQYLS